MSEEKTAGSDGASTADPIALGMVMGRTTPQVDDELIGYLRDQRHHLHEQLQQIHLDVWEKFLGVFLRLATAIVGVAAAGAVSWLIWQASQSNGLRIEPFSVPPDLAARGLTGQVMAAKLLDRLVALESQVNSARPAKSYANSWDQHGIKLEIPETAISLGELDSWLREKLGNDTRVTGEVVRTDEGLSVTARAIDSSQTVSGPEKDVDALVTRLAEQVYHATQPFRYGMYLAQAGRGPEALAVFQELALNGDKEDRLWAFNRWAVSVGGRDGVDAGLRLLDQAIASDPDAIGAYDNRSNYLGSKGWAERALRNNQEQLVHLTNGRQTYVAPQRIPIFKRVVEAKLAANMGHFREAQPIYVELSRAGYPGYSPINIRGPLITAQTGAHELSAARATLAEVQSLQSGTFVGSHMRIAFANENWADVLALESALAEANRTSAYGRSIFQTANAPILARAEAGLGRFAEAERRIAASPADCYECLLARGQIAALRGQHDRADSWFARAAAQGPSLPFADAEWGRALLARGKPDAAIEKFKIANQRAPRFVDALVWWGEALMAKNHSHRALAKFAEAEKYAPNWGRLHLKWGQALAYSGNKDEAVKHFARAAQLDLTPSEKAELAKQK